MEELNILELAPQDTSLLSNSIAPEQELSQTLRDGSKSQVDVSFLLPTSFDLLFLHWNLNFSRLAELYFTNIFGDVPFKDANTSVSDGDIGVRGEFMKSVK